MSREFPFPRAEDGTTVLLSTDLHTGRRPWTANQLLRAGQELDRMMSYCDGHIIGGDLIHWGKAATPEDTEYVAWENQRRAATSKPVVRVAGNHDLATFVSPYTTRTITQWKAATGFTQHNTVTDIGGLRVIAISPDDWPFVHVSPMSLPKATTDWLDAQVAATTKPVLVLTHPPLKEHHPGHMDDDTAARIASIIANRPNLVAWASGHRHCDIQTDLNHVKAVSYGARTIACINGPAAGGQPQNSVNDPWDAPLYATTISYRPGRVVVRWRNLLTRQWARHNGALSKELIISAY